MKIPWVKMNKNKLLKVTQVYYHELILIPTVPVIDTKINKVGKI